MSEYEEYGNSRQWTSEEDEDDDAMPLLDDVSDDEAAEGTTVTLVA